MPRRALVESIVEDLRKGVAEVHLETLRLLSGGSPVLVTYGLEHLCTSSASVLELETVFGVFREKYDGFIRSVHASVSHYGRLDAPLRVLNVVREHAGSVPM